MLTLIIPCYNEEKNLNFLLKKINDLIIKYNFIKILLVDNGSSDNTYDVVKSNIIFKNNRFILKKISKNIGYGYGIISGIKEADSEYISWTHADLQTDIEDVPKAFLEYKSLFKSSSKIFIKGNRKNRPTIDNFFTNAMSIISSFLTFSKLKDVNAQPKIFHKSLIDDLKKAPNDFMLDLYILIKANKKKYKILEYDVYFNKRKFGKAKGGGSLKGKIILSYKTLKYLILFKWK